MDSLIARLGNMVSSCRRWLFSGIRYIAQCRISKVHVREMVLLSTEKLESRVLLTASPVIASFDTVNASLASTRFFGAADEIVLIASGVRSVVWGQSFINH